MEKRVRGAIWSHFFRRFPEATSLKVESVEIQSENQGSAILQLYRSDQKELMQVSWELEEDSLIIKEHVLASS